MVMSLNCMQHVCRHFSRPILCQQRRNSRQGFEHIFDPPSGTQPIYIYLLFLYFIDLKKHMGSPQTVTFFSCGIHPTPVGIRRVILEDLIRQHLPKNNHHSAGSSIELFLPNCGVCSRFFLEWQFEKAVHVHGTHLGYLIMDPTPCQRKPFFCLYGA